MKTAITFTKIIPLILVTVAGSLSGCATRQTAIHALPEPKQYFNRAALLGVWEVTRYRELAGPTAKPGEHRPNLKCCFTESHAYLELAPDAANDSADGWQPYDILRDMIVFPGPIYEGIMHVRSLSKDRLELDQGGIAMTLRRVARSVDPDHFHTPILRPRSIPVQRIGQ